MCKDCGFCALTPQECMKRWKAWAYARRLYGDQDPMTRAAAVAYLEFLSSKLRKRTDSGH